MSDILSDLESINGVDGFDPRDAIRICQEAADEIERLTRELKELGDLPVVPAAVRDYEREQRYAAEAERDRLTRERDAAVEVMGECVSKGRRLEIEIDRLRAALEQWQKNCTGKHGSQSPCVAREAPRRGPPMCSGYPDYNGCQKPAAHEGPCVAREAPK